MNPSPGSGSVQLDEFGCHLILEFQLPQQSSGDNSIYL